MARHGDGIQQLQTVTGAHQEKSSLASELVTGGRNNRLSHGPFSGTGTAGFCRDCARLGGTLICLVLRDTGEGGSDEATVMLRVLLSWLANRLEGGERLQRPDVGVQGAIPLVFYTDAKAEDGRAWIGGFVEKNPECEGPWFSLEAEKGWAPWAFVKGGYEEGDCRP